MGTEGAGGPENRSEGDTQGIREHCHHCQPQCFWHERAGTWCRAAVPECSHQWHIDGRLCLPSASSSDPHFRIPVMSEQDKTSSALLQQHPPQQILHSEQPAVLESPGRTSETPQGTQGTSPCCQQTPQRPAHRHRPPQNPAHPIHMLCLSSQQMPTSASLLRTSAPRVPWPADLHKHVGPEKPRANCPRRWKRPLKSKGREIHTIKLWYGEQGQRARGLPAGPAWAQPS